jgi:hypothetical protein
MKVNLIGFKYFNSITPSSFNGIKLSGIKFLGFGFIYHKNEYTTLFIYFFTLCFNINLRTNDEYDKDWFHYYGPERKILKSIYPWYTGFFGISLLGKEFLGTEIRKDRIVAKFKPSIITNTFLRIKFTLLFYIIELKWKINERENEI